MLTALLAATAATMTPQQTEEFCYKMADFSVAAVEAREKGVPLDKVLALVRTLNDETGTLRRQVIKVYSDPSTGARITRIERQRAINQIAAQCIGELSNG